MATIDQRDYAVVQLVARFKQLTSRHIAAVLFADAKSHTPADRTLRRLVERRYLARIERRMVGGAHGGSGHYVYQLGPEGHRLFGTGRYLPAHAIHPHTLAIADAYVALVRQEQSGKLRIVGYLTEPDCHTTIGKYELKPDLYIELARPGSNTPGIRILFEVDMASQGKKVTAKLLRYWLAYEVAEASVWPSNQLVVFLAVTEQRASELRWLISRGEKEQQKLFRVVTAESLVEALLGSG